MFNKFLVMAGKIIYKKPTVHTKSPKMIVSYFSNSINPEPVIINLEGFNSVRLTTELEKKDGVADVYKLSLKFNVIGKELEDVCLARFETKKDAEEALYLLTYKLHSPFKGFFKALATLIALFFIYIVVDIVTFDNLSSTQANMKDKAKMFQSMPIDMQKRMLELEGISVPQQPISETTNNPQVKPTMPEQAMSVPPVLSEEELKALFDEAVKLTNEANQGNSNLSVDVPNLGEQPKVTRKQGSFLTPGDAFLNNL